MDDLDRLYRLLVDTLRAEAPHLLRQRFTVGDLAQQLVPYRLHRRTLGFDSIQQYEHALLRLVSGERGYLASEAVVRDAARQALSGPQPDADALRRFADAPAALAPEPLRAILGDLPPDQASQPAAQHAPSPAPTPSMPAMPASSHLAGTPAAASLPADRPVAHAPAPVSDQPPPMPFPTRPATPVVGGRCPYCGQALPEGRAVTFCPYCGQNVTVVRCPACSTELEAGWRFCVTCGRAMDGAGAGPAG
ncbi:zinc ribbon domain-containing protein [Roseisolibacter agri]|nr:zinc ribbon domain-containing protein [Roseisolibacter agri]